MRIRLDDEVYTYLWFALFAVACLSLGGCASRALVTDCKEAGPGVLNCEIVKKL